MSHEAIYACVDCGKPWGKDLLRPCSRCNCVRAMHMTPDEVERLQERWEATDHFEDMGGTKKRCKRCGNEMGSHCADCCVCKGRRQAKAQKEARERWTPGSHEQAESRLHRTPKPVTVEYIGDAPILEGIIHTLWLARCRFTSAVERGDEEAIQAAWQEFDQVFMSDRVQAIILRLADTSPQRWHEIPEEARQEMERRARQLDLLDTFSLADNWEQLPDGRWAYRWERCPWEMAAVALPPKEGSEHEPQASDE